MFIDIVRLAHLDDIKCRMARTNGENIRNFFFLSFAQNRQFLRLLG